MEVIEKIESWYMSQCNGDWEHDFGLKIDTLDNPGWRVTIDLQLTSLQGVEFEKQVDTSELDWYHITVRDNKFVGFGDSKKLKFLLSYFIDVFVPMHSKEDFTYDILIPLIGAPAKIWTPGKGKMLRNGEFEVVEIQTPNSKTFLCKSLDLVQEWIEDFNFFHVDTKVGDTITCQSVMTFQGIRLAKKD